MNWTPVRFKRHSNGQYAVMKKVYKQQGYQFLNKYLENLHIEFIKINYKHYQFSKHLTFEYEEKQLLKFGNTF